MFLHLISGQSQKINTKGHVESITGFCHTNWRRYEQLWRWRRLASPHRWLCRVVPEARAHSGHCQSPRACVRLADDIQPPTARSHQPWSWCIEQHRHRCADIFVPAAVSLPAVWFWAVYNWLGRCAHSLWVVQLTKLFCGLYESYSISVLVYAAVTLLLLADVPFFRFSIEQRYSLLDIGNSYTRGVYCNMSCLFTGKNKTLSFKGEVRQSWFLLSCESRRFRRLFIFNPISQVWFLISATRKQW